MNDLDIDETLPGQEIEEDSKEEVIRRENSISSSGNSASFSFNDESPSEAEKAESLRGWLYLIAGAGYGTLVVYLGRDIGVSSLTLKGLVRRSVKFDFKGHNIVPLKEEE